MTAVVLMGCYHHESIRPDQLPALNGAYTTQVGTATHTTYTSTGLRTMSSPIMASTVQHVIALDGRTVEVEGEFDAVVVPRNAQALEFTHPVMSNIDGTGMLEVRGGNRGPSRIHISEVERVDVTWPDHALTGVAAGVGGILAGVVVAGIILAATQ